MVQAAACKAAYVGSIPTHILKNMENVENYLKNKLINCSHYTLTNADRAVINAQGIEEYIFTKLTSKKFRKWALADVQKDLIKGIIRERVKAGLPLLFTFPFGGYKLWRVTTAPEVDWAEFLSLAYMLEFLAPVAAAYQPGFEFYFTSDEVIIERMDNIPKEETDKYTNSFNVLLLEFLKYTPVNAKMKLICIRDLFTPEEFEIELKKLLPQNLDELWDSQPEEKKQRRFKMSGLNINMNGKEDWASLSKQEQEQKIKLGSIYHDAYISIPKRMALVKGPDKIIIFPFAIPGIACIPIGSTRASVSKFWTGNGVLVKNEASFKDIILSPSQIEALVEVPSQTVPVSLIPLNNFKEIKVFDRNLGFSDIRK